MSLYQPSFEEYKIASKEIIDFSKINGLDYCIYGSFLHEGKLRNGLSDIDGFIISNDNGLVFPIKITIAFGEIKEKIEMLGIPLQINFNTIGKIRSRTFSPDKSYIEEVKRGIEKGLSSENFRNIIQNSNFRDEKLDDLEMLRLYYKKINQIGLLFYDVGEIIKKEKNEITREEQEKLVKFWDSFKKMLSIITLSIRIFKGESNFSKKDSEIIETFKINFNIDKINEQKYLNVLQKVKSISDWFEFLKNGGLNQIIDIYENIFNPILEKISYKLEK